VASAVSSGFALQKANALDFLDLVAAIARTMRLGSVDLLAATLSTTMRVTARSFRNGGHLGMTLMSPRRVRTRCRPASTMLQLRQA